MSNSQREDADREAVAQEAAPGMGRELLIWIVVVGAAILVVAGSAAR